jgi:hypothetical protein
MLSLIYQMMTPLSKMSTMRICLIILHGTRRQQLLQSLLSPQMHSFCATLSRVIIKTYFGQQVRQCFGAKKSYVSLRDSFFWPGMHKDICRAYISGYIQCQKNKSSTSMSAGPLHPLPIPNVRGNSIAMDFIGPLPEDDGFNAIFTITDCLGHADICIIPTQTDISAANTALLLYDNWYLENSLPLDIVSDCDPQFIADFWKAFCKLTRVKQKISSAHHPQTNGASEVTNKTVIQYLHFYVERHQRGWVKALSIIHFTMINTVNSSTDLSGFQVWMGHSPRILPPLVPSLPEITTLHCNCGTCLPGPLC